MKGVKFSILLSLVLRCWLIQAQEVEVNAELDTNRALIGDQVELYLHVKKPSQVQVEFPAIKDTITGKVEVINAFPVDTSSETAEYVHLDQELLVTVFDTGLYVIPPLPFVIKSGARNDTIHTLPLYIAFSPVKADSTIRDIKGIYRVPVSAREIVPYVLLAIALLAVAWFSWKYIKNRHRHVEGKPVRISTEPPEVTALRELEQLRAEKLWMNNKVKLLHIRVSEILRTYIEQRFQIAALEQTTDEILASLKSSVCEASDIRKLATVLQLADLVKFAKVIPGNEENITQLDLSADFVNSTTVHAIPEPEEAGGSNESMVQHNSSF